VGDLALIGNTLMTCPGTKAPCRDAQSGAAVADNNDFVMGRVDVDGDGTTFDSSAATATLPAGSTVLFAGLYWGADTSAGASGAAAPNAAAKDTVRFKVGTGAYQTLTAAAADVYTSTSQPTRYQAFEDVTSLVTGSGTYTLANVQSGTGTDRYAGWSMVIAYRDPTRAIRRLNVYDGLGSVGNGSPYSTTLTGFHTTAASPTATFGMITYEGDRGLTGETVKINGQTVSDAFNPADNVFNSTFTVNGARFTAKNPNYENQLGYDADFNDAAAGMIPATASSATLDFTSTQDVYMPGVFLLASDEGPATNTAPPIVSGIARDGQLLTATTGTWDGTPTITYAYEWQRCDSAGALCAPIAGATSSTYSLTAADVGSRVRVLVTATNDAGSASAPSSPTALVTAAPPVNTSAPTFTGTQTDGQTLTAQNGTWTGTAPLTYTYAWQRCDSAGANCAAISGATASTYTLTSAEVGRKVRVAVTATNSAGNATAFSVTSGSIAARPPANVTAPVISGTVQHGQTLTSSNGTWTGTAPLSFTYQWRRCDGAGANCVDIAGATANTYTLVAADVGARITVKVTATNSAGNANASATPTTAVAAAPPVNTSVPTITGTPRDGSVLTGDRGTWTGTDPITYTQRWQRCDSAGTNCTDIAGATSGAYTAAGADVGSRLRVVYTGTNAAGNSSANSAPTSVVTAAPPVNVSAPTFTGTQRDGQTLTAANGAWTGTAPLTYTYAWQSCDSAGANCAPISSATASTYTLTSSDVGRTVRVAVTATNSAGSATAQSAPSGTIAARPPANVTAPLISGTVQHGQTLTSSNGTWTGTAPLTFTFQWRRCDSAGANCVDIASATASTYTLVAADVGARITVTVTATNSAGNANASAAPTSVVAPAPPVNTSVPTVTGTPRDGSVLTGDQGTWTGTAPITYTQRWQRCDSAGANCTDITGTTNSTYTAANADIGSRLRVIYTATNAAGSASANSVPTSVVTVAPPVNTNPPAVSGTPRDGDLLSSGADTWSGSTPMTFTYQWRRCNSAGASCVDLAGATATDYRATGADIGSTLRVRVTATNAGGSTPQDSPASTVVVTRPPANVTVPTISGTPRDGQTLTSSNGTWTGTTPLTYTYQWTRCDSAGANCVDIAGATASSYTLVTGDVDARIRVRVTASNTAGNAAATSLPTALVTQQPPAFTAVPVLSGTARDGQTLTGDNGTVTGSRPLTYTYAWERCNADGSGCAFIPGAMSATRPLGAADVGKRLRITVTATNAAGTASASSALSSVVAPTPPLNGIAPSQSGSARDGQTLTADPGVWSGTAPITYAYQWQRCDASGSPCANMTGATGQTLVLISDDIGDRLRVVVTATNAAGSANATSTPTSVVVAAPPVAANAPVITGSPVDGRRLSAAGESFTGTQPITVTLQWLRCDGAGTCSSIAGATGRTYDLVAADIGSTLEVRATGTNSVGSDSISSAATGTVAPAPPVNSVRPVVSGTPRDGSNLTVSQGTWTGTDPISYAVQWQRCHVDGTNCADISGATSSTYTAGPADVGHALRAAVTATNVAGTATSTSLPTSRIGELAPDNRVLPTIGGEPRDGGTLTVDTGAWDGTEPLTYTYQWRRCDANGTGCSDITNETGATYQPTVDDVDGTVRVVVTATNPAGSQSVTSGPTTTIAARAPVAQTAADIQGTPRDGEVLTSDPATFTGTEPMTITLQWLRCDANGDNCQAIDGATNATHSVSGDDVGSTLRLRSTATNAAGSDTITGAATTLVVAAPPAGDVAPDVTGIPRDGQTLTADPGTFSGTAPMTLSYRWQRCDADGTNCAAIPGATGDTYDLVAADVGHSIRVAVTATNDAGSDTMTSPSVGPVQALPPVNDARPDVSGEPRQGSDLTAGDGDWSGTRPIAFTYQWQRCDANGASCADIAGATQKVYTATAADTGSTLRVLVTGTNPAGADTATSPASGVVLPPAPAVAQDPTVSGTPREGALLTAGPATFTGAQPMTTSVRWQRCDADGSGCQDIAGATDPTYRLTGADVGKTIRVIETATNAGGNTSATSARTGGVAGRAPVNVVPPVLGGEPVEGEELTSSAGDWDGTAPLTTSIRWQRCDADGTGCTDIPGATGTTYRLVAADAGHVVRSMATASNVVGDASEPSRPSAAVRAKPAPPEAPAPKAEAPAPTPDPVVDPKPTPEPSSTPAPAPVATASDLGDVPGSLVNETSCQQMVGGSVFKRVKLRGIGDVRVRAYSLGAAVPRSPLKVTTQVLRARRVTYSLDGRTLPAAKGRTFLQPIGPAALRKAGTHTLRVTILPAARAAKAATVTLTLKTVKCSTLFSVQRWRTTAGTGLRLRVDSRTAVRKLAFRMPAALLARQGVAPRAIGTIRFVSAGGKKVSQKLTLPKRGGAAVLLKGAGKPTVSYAADILTVDGIPERTGVVELTTYREVRRDGRGASRASAINALVIPAAGAAQNLKGTARGVRGR